MGYKRIHCRISNREMAEALYRLDLSYTHPTHILGKADKEKQRKFKIDFKKQKNTSVT